TWYACRWASSISMTCWRTWTRRWRPEFLRGSAVCPPPPGWRERIRSDPPGPDSLILPKAAVIRCHPQRGKSRGPMETNDLKQTLSKLHLHLEAQQPIDAELRDLLRVLDQDIHQLLA